MDFNNVTKGKAVPLGIIIIIITYLVSGANSSILPFVFFAGILVGIMKNSDVTESLVASLLASFIGSLVGIIISVALMYVSYGSAYLLFMLSSSLYIFILYVIVGGIGGIIGYYISKEIEHEK